MTAVEKVKERVVLAAFEKEPDLSKRSEVVSQRNNF